MGTTYRVSVCDKNETSCVVANPSPQYVRGTIASCRVYMENYAQQSPTNGDGNVYISLLCNNHEELKLKFERLSGNGRIDLWISGDGEFLSGSLPDGFGGYQYTVASPGTARRAITVGAIGGYTDILSEYGRIAFFSSRGPTRDGRIKPEVVANGFYVCAANYNFSPYADPNRCGSSSRDYYIPIAGTSISAPVVTALVALYLQDNPTATPEQVKAWLINNAVYTPGEKLGIIKQTSCKSYIQ